MTQSSDIYESGARIIERPISFKLPQLSEPPAANSLPIMAALVPVIGGVTLWLVLSSPYALIFAALGPLMLAASVIDGKRSRRRTIRSNKKKFRQQLNELDEKISSAKDRQRNILAHNQPDLWGFVSRSEQIWRPAAQLQDFINVGTGPVLSCIEISGEIEHEDATELYTNARRLDDAAVTIATELGIVVVGSNAGLNASVVRALVLQMCARFAPEKLKLSWGSQMPASETQWLSKLPQGNCQSEVILWVAADATETIPAAARYVIVTSTDAQYPTPRCAARIVINGDDTSILETPRAKVPLKVEGVTIAQAEAVAEYLAERDLTRSTQASQIPDSLGFDELLQAFAHQPQSLKCEIGSNGIEVTTLDLVNEGPHALVTGMTGSGKSELLITWLLAMCRAYTPEELQLLLVDFKGGSAFNTLTSLPHLASLVTDLDQNETQRVIKALRAEIMRREEALAELGARNIGEAGNKLARLVVAVDEYAALISSDPDFVKVFADLAARGRSLGIHLILGSQRASGVFNDSILANCPLRLSLRVNDEQDSRLMLGIPDAAQLSGAKSQRGIALLLSPEHEETVRFRVALSKPDHVKTVRAANASYPDALAICPPPLASEILLAELTGETENSFVLGRFDEPEYQRQGTAQISHEIFSLAIVGDAATGKTNALAVLAAQSDPRRTVYLDSNNPELAWDELHRLSRRTSTASTVIIDDLDQILLSIEGEHAQAMVQLLEQLLRQARQLACRFFISARAANSPATRILDLCEQKILLHCTSKADYLNHGGESVNFQTQSVAGRAYYQKLVTQIAKAPRAVEQPVNSAQNVTLLEYLADYADVGNIALVAYGEQSRDEIQVSARASGFEIMHLDDYHSATSAPQLKVILYADPDTWQRNWETLHRIKTKGMLLIDPNCASYYRLITGSRQLPPFVDYRQPRLWGMVQGGEVIRLALEAG